MNDDIDPLELELAALVPLEISPQLWQDVAERLAEIDRPSNPEDRPRRGGQSPFAHGASQKGTVPDGSRSRRWWLVVAGSGFVAAGLAAVVFHSLGNYPGPARTLYVQPTRVQTFDVMANTLLSYERAWAQSADEFESLLDKNARNAPSDPGVAAVSVLSWSDPKTTALLGEE
jgi:hypothetical protein